MGLLALAASSVLAGPALSATAAPIVSSDIELMLDGTGQGTANGCLVEDAPGVPVDASSTDGVVCTDDRVQYGWNYSIPAEGSADVTFSQTLPAGWSWNELSLTSCTGGDDYTGTAALSADGLTLTCVLNFPDTGAARSGQLPVFAIPEPGVPDGTVYTAELSVSQPGTATQSSEADPVTVRAQPRWNLSKTLRQVDYNGAEGPFQVDFGSGPETAVLIQYGASIGTVAGNNYKGQEPLAAPVTFTDVVSEIDPEAILMGCFAFYGEVPFTCEQPGGPGTNIAVTLPNGMPVPPEGGYPGAQSLLAMQAGVNVYIPLRNLPPYPEPQLTTNQFNDFDPSGPTGQSNLGPSYETGSEPNATCYVANDNCVAVNVTRPVPGAGPVGAGKAVRQQDSSCNSSTYASCNLLEGTTGASVGQPQSGNHDGLAYRGDDLVAGFYITYDPRRDLPTNVVICDKWDPALQTVNPDGFGVEPHPGTANITGWQYTNRVYTDDEDRQQAGCGTLGDAVTDGPWFDTIDAAGGPDAVTGARTGVPVSFATCCIPASLPMKVGANVPAGTVIPDFLSLYYDQMDSTDNPDRWSYVSFDSYRVNDLQLSLDKDTAPKGQTGAVSGARTNFTLDVDASTPGATAPRTLDGLSVTDILDSCLSGAQLNPATEGWSMAVASGDLGPDGIACTADDVSGDVLTFTPTVALETATPIEQIRYSVIVSVLVVNGQTLDNTATVNFDGTLQSAETRTDAWQLVVAAPGAARVSKVADQSVVEINPDTISWTINYANTLSTNLGTTRFIDLLPHNGDGRGTVLNGEFGFAGAEKLGSTDATLFYTTDAVGTVNTDPQANTSNWVESTLYAGDLADVTAVLIVANNLTAGATGSIRIHAAPTGNVEGNIYGNDVGAGRSDSLQQPIPPTLISQISVVASSIGDRVWFDENADGVQDASEAGIEGVTLNLLDSAGVVVATTVTGPDGIYEFAGYHSGDYQVQVDPTTLPAGYAATYDLDNGTTGPNGDSGQFSLGINVDRPDVDFGYVRLAGELSVTKLVEGAAANYSGGSYEIVVMCVNARGTEAGFPKTLTFQGAGSQTITDISLGAECTATETVDGGATKVTVSPAGAVVIGTPGAPPAAITVTNDFRGGSLVIAKALDGAGAADFGNGPFTFGVVCSFNGADDIFTGDVVLSRMADEVTLISDPITGLPIGAVCVVTETDNGGADATPAPVTITIAENESQNTVTAAFVNEFSAGSISLSKVLAGNGAETPDALESVFTVQVTCEVELPGEPSTRGTVFSGTIDIRGGDTVLIEDADGNPLLLPIGTHCWADETDQGGASESAVNFDSYENAAIVTAGSPDDLQELELTATNTFVTAELVVSKTVVGPGASGPYSFSVECTREGVEYILDAGDDEFTLSHGESRTIVVGAGVDCAVTELNPPTGATVSMIDSDASSGGGASDGVVLNIAGEARVDVTNTFAEIPVVTPPGVTPPVVTPPGVTPPGVKTPVLVNTGLVVGGGIAAGAALLLLGGVLMLVSRARREKAEANH